MELVSASNGVGRGSLRFLLWIAAGIEQTSNAKTCIHPPIRGEIENGAEVVIRCRFRNQAIGRLDLLATETFNLEMSLVKPCCGSIQENKHG